MSSHLYRMLVLSHFIVGVAIYYFSHFIVDRSSEKRGPRMYPCLCVRRRTIIPKKLVQFLLTSVPLESHYFYSLLYASHKPSNLSIRSRLLWRNLAVRETEIIRKGLEFIATCWTYFFRDSEF